MNFVKPHKISTHSAHLDNFFFHFFYPLSDDIGGILGIILQVGIYVCIGLERSRKKEDE